ncbi:MAG TPA: hypothetical protein VGF97_19390 [Rhizomicrobium sp.]
MTQVCAKDHAAESENGHVAEGATNVPVFEEVDLFKTALIQGACANDTTAE